jgi:hypothetical protein
MIKILTLILFFSAFPLHAEEFTDNQDNTIEQFFETEGKTRLLLKTYGISGNEVNWVKIDQICSPLKSISDIAENRCKFEKARLNADFNNNKKFCLNLSETEYGDFLNDDRVAKFIRKTDDGIEEFTLFERKLSGSEIRDRRENHFLKCMNSFGWKSSSDWESGRINN